MNEKAGYPAQVHAEDMGQEVQYFDDARNLLNWSAP